MSRINSSEKFDSYLYQQNLQNLIKKLGGGNIPNELTRFDVYVCVYSWYNL